MSKLKERKIRNLRRKRVWPSILGLVALVLICIFMLSAIMIFSMIDVVERKIQQSYEVSKEAADLYVNESDDVSEATQTETEEFVKYTNGVEAVSVLSDSGNSIWSTNGNYPDVNNAVITVNVGVSETEQYNVIIEEDEYGIFDEDSDELEEVLEDSFGKYMTMDELIMHVFSSGLGEDERLIGCKIWVVINKNNMQVCVLNDSSIYTSDFRMIFAGIGIAMAVMTLFAIYYLLTLVGVFISQHRITKLFYTDMVTGGENWAFFVKRGARLLKKNRKGKYNYAMVHIRMEKYRSFCTCFGAKEGEELIERFYIALKKQLKKKEIMAYHENADFGLLITYVDQEELLTRVRQMEEQLQKIFPNIKMYFSIGISYVENSERDIERLYNGACLARRMIAEDAKERIAFFDVELSKQQIWERKVEDCMERALMNREFKVYLQPKYSAKEESLAGAEALVRWIHPEEGIIPPFKFIPIFEQNGFILQLDDYMLEEVARQQAEWLAAGKKVVPISVNVSRAHFTREDLADHISRIVDKYNVPHNVIELELTESAFFDDKLVLLNTVQQLRSSGFIVSMDDFGAGYSSLNSLKELHLDVLKIDADFFRGVDSVERGMLIVSEVIDLAKKLDMKIVAEGIESREQVDFLAEQECDLIQGYYFAKPMPIAEFEEKYQNETEQV